MNYNSFILFLSCLLSVCFCEISEETRTKLLSDFINYCNQRPDADYKASDGFLRSVSEIDDKTYQIEVSFCAKHADVSKLMKCSAGIQDLDDGGIAVVNNAIDCEEIEQQAATDADASTEAPEVQAEKKPVLLENEENADTGVASGEQFIAIPRVQPSAPCIGCSSHVNPQAQGVQDLANMGVRHLDIHEPGVKHSLDSVIDVERQVQVINGVRYILTLSINFNNCTEALSDSCLSTKTCRISILVKPWQTLRNGAKYRSILSNNCTEEYLFGDNGEVLPEATDADDHNNKDGSTSPDSDEIKVEVHKDVQSVPGQEHILTADEIKALEQQIVPYDQVSESSTCEPDTLSPAIKETNKDHDLKIETNQLFVSNSIPKIEFNKPIDFKTEANQLFPGNSIPKTEFDKPVNNLDPEKKKTIDEFLDFMKFSDFS